MVELRGKIDAKIDTALVRHMILNTLRSYKQKFGSEYGQLVIACDSRNYWRKEVFKYYKSNRKKARETSSFDWKAIFDALNTVKRELIEYFPYPVIDVDRAEADDVIASLVFWSQNNDLLQEDGLFGGTTPRSILILSGDHDFEQLQRYKNVKQWSTNQRKWVKIKEHADSVLMEHILIGDKGDGVPNFKTADDAFHVGGRQTPIRKKDLAVWKTMTPESWLLSNSQYADNFRRNQLVIDLRLVPIDIQEAIINSYAIQRDARDRTKLLNYFMEYKLRNMIDLITEF